VDITTPQGTATLPNGYTYLATSIGQSTNGGVIACLDGGLDNLISAITDNSTGIQWGGFGTAVSAASVIDGDANTAAIVTTLGNNGGAPYAAQLCANYEIDSQGNSPCESGNACYADWFLPAKNQLACLFTNRISIGGFQSAPYWTSTEFSSSPSLSAMSQNFSGGAQLEMVKSNSLNVRCVSGL
jgi:hypothetical protein